ncbi:MAG: xanthine dehydrogenase family protein subunit M [Hyphomicrobiales bacterium]|nr:xanthine dehydrogenase family protein subunit M [Hyphomicrobiales bacterium]MBV9433845.1 xanthine dehydrogenase family protein subunit M [Hyphomicrobiales bacterium]MBV9741050.1 xanthine dehydrogenase family protein subunit M [Hyphomicrobiales bacterium]
MPIYLRPASLKAALSTLAQASGKGRSAHPLTVLAGGTDIYPTRAGKQAWLESFPRDFLDITQIPQLRGIRRDGRAILIGAATTWTDIVAARLPPAFDALKQAALQIGGLQIQNRGTLGGNIVNASPAADGVPPLLALDAEVDIASERGERSVPLASFIRGNRQTGLARDELVVAIRLPGHRASSRSLFLKLGARSHLVISIVSVGTLLDQGADGTIADIRITVGAASAVPTRLAALEAELRGERLDASLIERVTPGLFSVLTPLDDVRASSHYRRDAARILVRRALANFMEPQAEEVAA